MSALSPESPLVQLEDELIALLPEGDVAVLDPRTEAHDRAGPPPLRSFGVILGLDGDLVLGRAGVEQRLRNLVGGDHLLFAARELHLSVVAEPRPRSRCSPDTAAVRPGCGVGDGHRGVGIALGEHELLRARRPGEVVARPPSFQGDDLQRRPEKVVGDRDRHRDDRGVRPRPSRRPARARKRALPERRPPRRLVRLFVLKPC